MSYIPDVVAVDNIIGEVGKLRECSRREIKAGAGAAGAQVHHPHRHGVPIVTESVLVPATASIVIQVGVHGTHEVTIRGGFPTRANCTIKYERQLSTHLNHVNSSTITSSLGAVTREGFGHNRAFPKSNQLHYM